MAPVIHRRLCNSVVRVGRHRLRSKQPVGAWGGRGRGAVAADEGGRQPPHRALRHPTAALGGRSHRRVLASTLVRFGGHTGRTKIDAYRLRDRRAPPSAGRLHPDGRFRRRAGAGIYGRRRLQTVMAVAHAAAGTLLAGRLCGSRNMWRGVTESDEGPVAETRTRRRRPAGRPRRPYCAGSNQKSALRSVPADYGPPGLVRKARWSLVSGPGPVLEGNGPHHGRNGRSFQSRRARPQLCKLHGVDRANRGRRRWQAPDLVYDGWPGGDHSDNVRPQTRAPAPKGHKKGEKRGAGAAGFPRARVMFRHSIVAGPAVRARRRPRCDRSRESWRHRASRPAPHRRRGAGAGRRGRRGRRPQSPSMARTAAQAIFR